MQKTRSLPWPLDPYLSSDLSSSRISGASSAGVLAQNVLHTLVLDDVRCVLETLHVDGVNSHGENHLALVDDTLNTHDVGHAESQGVSLDTGALAVDIGFDVCNGEGMLIANDGVALFGLLDVVAKVKVCRHAVKNGARQNGETLAEFVAVAACGFVFDSDASVLA